MPIALALAAAEGVREAAHELRPQPDQPQQLLDAIDSLLPAADAIDQQRLADDVEDRHARVERRETDPGRSSASAGAAVAAVPRQRRPRRPPPRSRSGTGSRPPWWVDRAQDAARGRRLAAAALADQRQRLARRMSKLTSSTARTCPTTSAQKAAPDRIELRDR